MSARLWWVAILTVLPQVSFMILEMFFWNSDIARSISGLTNETAEATNSIGRNMGLYNGLLAAGLAWSIYASPRLGEQPILFFVGFMAIAGIFGGLTINPTFNVGVTINPGILLAQGGFALGAMFILRYL
jgi:putative membrane protein